MSAIARKALFALCAAAVAVVVGWFALVLLPPTFGKVVGYANEQPPLRVVQSSVKSPPEEVERMLRLAKLHFQNIPTLEQLYWPEPSLIEEHKECWLVAFTRKVPIYQWLGHREIVRHPDEAMFISITKSNYSARFGRWCH
ncbi:MAG: hypothetical protein N3B01_03580 [Verrucomicrobiae bacterium]|nr:hypothetical protein [Verrucomicrobiae bacterium]